jgi:hypothetical protein
MVGMTTDSTPQLAAAAANPADSVTLALVAAIEATWAAIRAEHPDVPRVVVTIGAGTRGSAPGQVTFGHYAGARWVHTTAGDMPELFIGGEGLAHGARELLGTLLHEAAHGIAATRAIKDTSRQGRYHNTSYKQLAQEVGLKVTKDDRIGWSDTSVPASTATAYAEQEALLAAAITAHRRTEYAARTLPTMGDDGEAQAGAADTGRPSSDNGVAARCGCDRRVRVAASVLQAGPIICGLCGTEFTAPPTDDTE